MENKYVSSEVMSKGYGDRDKKKMKALKNKDNTQSALINAVKVNLQMGGKSNG